MAAPVLQAEGAIAVVTTGNLTVVLPAHQADDILCVVMVGWVPNSTTGANTVAAPGGWTKQLNDTLITSTLIDGEWALFWRRAAGTESDPVFTRPTGWDTGTDTCWAGRAFVVRGCVTSGDPFDAAVKSALYSAANQSLPAVTVSGAERTVVQFHACSDDQSNATGPTSAGWTKGTYARTTTGTDAQFDTLRKDDVSASTTADGTTIAAPVQGRYIYFGVSFKAPVAPRTISSTKSLPLVGAIALAAALSVGSAKALPLSGAAELDNRVTISSTKALPLGGSIGLAVASPSAVLSSTRALPLVGDVDVGVRVVLGSSRALPLAGTAALSHPVLAGSTRPVVLAGSVGLAVRDTLSSVRALPLGGAQTLRVGVRLTSGHSLPLGGSVGLTVGSVAVVASVAPLPLTGSLVLSNPLAVGTSGRLPLNGTVALAHACTLSSVASLPLSGVVQLGHESLVASSGALPLAGTVAFGVSDLPPPSPQAQPFLLRATMTRGLSVSATMERGLTLSASMTHPLILTATLTRVDDP